MQSKIVKAVDLHEGVAETRTAVVAAVACSRATRRTAVPLNMMARTGKPNPGI